MVLVLKRSSGLKVLPARAGGACSPAHCSSACLFASVCDPFEYGDNGVVYFHRNKSISPL